MSKIVLDSVSKVFGSEVVAVDDVSLEIEDGEFMVLVGPSGCGKSTILRLLAGLEDVTSGEIFIGDRQVTDLPPKQRDVAMVSRTTPSIPTCPWSRISGSAWKLRHTPEGRGSLRAWPRSRGSLELDALLDRKPVLSREVQRQRVAMGRAMVRKPLAFLMERAPVEPGYELRVQSGRARPPHERPAHDTVYVTPRPGQAMTLGNRVAVMKDGVLQQVDTPQRCQRPRQSVRRGVHRARHR